MLVSHGRGVCATRGLCVERETGGGDIEKTKLEKKMGANGLVCGLLLC